MPHRLAFLLGFLGSLVLALPASAGTLCGTVRDASTNAPVDQAGVFLRETTGAYTGYSTGTATDGSFCLSNVPAGTYDLEIRRDDYAVGYLRGVVVTESAVDVGVLVGAGLELASPAPNPATVAARLAWTQPAAGSVTLRIVDAAGRFVRRWGGDATAGTHAIAWDLRDAGGVLVASGSYFVVLESGGARRVRTLIRIR
jgi:hypothetical protein